MGFYFRFAAIALLAVSVFFGARAVPASWFADAAYLARTEARPPESLAPFGFAVIGDSGCGCPAQKAVAERLIEWHSLKPFSTVLMVGDNIYGQKFYRGFYFFRNLGGAKELFEPHFDRYYDSLRDDGVKFYAVLGNHDYETNDGRDLIADKDRFHILGERGYYSFQPETDEKDLVTFFALNSMTLVSGSDREQIEWFKRELKQSKSRWKIVYYHHPMYTAPGKHRPAETFLKPMEPILVDHGVQVTFAGHNHFYARMKPQRGIVHFTTGGGGAALKTPVPSDMTARVARAYHFIYLEVFHDRIKFWAVPPSGPVLDFGEINHKDAKARSYRN